MTLRRPMVLVLAALLILAAVPARAQQSATPPAAEPECDPAVGSDATPGSSPASDATPEPGIAQLCQVAQLTGPDSINETHTRYHVDGTDLGHTFEHDGAIYMVFGDTFGPAKSDWRSNVAAVITDTDPSDGLAFDRMIEDLPGHAGALIKPSMVDGTEVTIIPTYGVSLGDRMVLHYMAVREWGPPGRWDLNASGLAYSDDDGQTWTVDPAATWPGDSNFGQVAIVPLDDHAYVFGIPGGRFGGVHLARVELASILDKASYEYWDGTAWAPDGEATAQTIIPAPVGELSVRWNAYYGKWLMMYLNEDRYAIVLRTADCLTGPWSEERTVATGAEYPQLYAPFMLPRWNDGPEISFTMSLFGPYNVYLMQTSLSDVEASSAPPECV